MYRPSNLILTVLAWLYSVSAFGIINGAPAFHPRVVTIGEFEKHADCKGILYEQDIVITAKHCLRSVPREVYIHSLQRSFKIRDTKTVSPISDPNPATDLAILLIEKVMDNNIQNHPIKLSNFELPQEMSVISYGGTHSKNDFDATQISAGLFKVITTNPYFESKQTVILEPLFDDAQEDLRMCKGDSGGPNIITVNNTEYLVGLNSYGIKTIWNALKSGTLVIEKVEDCLQTRVRILSISQYYQWINSAVKLLRQENRLNH